MSLAEIRTRYTGKTAAEYEAKRQGAKWQREHEAVGALLSDVAPGSMVLDIPVGTGRFIKHYIARDLDVIGMDVSADMMDLARRKGLHCREGSIFAIPLAPGAVDYAVCVRFMNWLDLDDLRLALGELARVTRRQVICGVRLKDQRSPTRSKGRVHTVQEFNQAMSNAGLRIDDAQEVHRGRADLYSMLRLGHVD